MQLPAAQMGAGLLVVSALLAVCSASINVPTVSLLKPQGIRFAVADVPGTNLVAFHYSINVPLYGVKAGQWNVDVRMKSEDGTWVHENKEANVKPGDIVYYWIHRIRYGMGDNLVEQEWVAVSDEDSGTTPDATGITPTTSELPTTPTGSSGDKYRLVFVDEFRTPTVDPSKWNHDVSLFGGFNGEFQAYTPETQNSYVKEDTLYLMPTLTADKFGEDFLRKGRWDMNDMYGRCTNDGNSGCLKNGKDGLLNPIMSGKLSSKGAIKYGRVEILAKLPKGDWIWPAIWLMPRDSKYGGWPRSGEIDIAEAIGNKNYSGRGIWQVGSTLHWGVDAGSNRYPMTHQTKTATGSSYADGFRKYVLDWTKDYIKVLVDDEVILHVPTPSEGFFRWGSQPGDNIWSSGDKNAPFDEYFYVILNVAVGGTNGFIPDGLINYSGYPKPWRNSDSNSTEQFWSAKNQWYPTWNGEDAAMQVKYVKMWQLN